MLPSRAKLVVRAEALLQMRGNPLCDLLAEPDGLTTAEICILLILVADALSERGGPAVAWLEWLVDGLPGDGPIATLVGPESRLQQRKLIETIDVRPHFILQRLRLTAAAWARLIPGVRPKPVTDDGESADAAPLIERVSPRVRLADVVLAPAVRQPIVEALGFLKLAPVVCGDWGFGEAQPGGGGTVLLFSGPPGTGKTFTAEAVAGELGRSLCRLRIEEAISKWRGVGEKRTVAAFREAQEHGDVLLLDEVDALLSSRTEGMKNWEVSEINVFLQELEMFTGVVILTTNRAESLDPALERRVTARVEFGIPTVADRLLLWKLNLPPRAPLAGDVDLPRLAASYPLTGAVIRTVCRLGSIRAAQREGDERVIRQADLEDVAAAHGMRGVGTKSVIGFR